MHSKPASERRRPPPRIRRALEVVYGISGVTAARIWHWADRIAIGIRGSGGVSHSYLLRRVEEAVQGLREPGERWEFGVMVDDKLPESSQSVPSSNEPLPPQP